MIQKLMAKETSLRDIGTEAALNEAGAAATKIAEIMLRHKIDMSEVEMQAAEAEDPIDREVYKYGDQDEYRARTRQAWEIQLASSTARAHDCRVLVGNGYFVFVGRSRDRAIAMQMFRILRYEVTQACTFGYREARRQGRPTRGYIASFMVTAVMAIAKRYKDMKTEVVESTNSQALVLRIDADLDAFLAGAKSDKTKPRGSINTLGARQGTIFGQNVSLQSQALGSDRAPAAQLGDGS